MGRAREKLRQGRRDLHREMSVPALYIAPVENAVPVPCSVRPQDKPLSIGAPKGMQIQGFAEIQDVSPKLVFLTDDAPSVLRAGAIVTVAAGEGYRIEKVDPAHDITITADVTRLKPAEMAGLPLP